MPIKPENKHRYPANWKAIRAGILERANNRCEFCGVQNYAHIIRFGKGIEYGMEWNYSLSCEPGAVKIVLTIAHLDHVPENCDPANLRALCQKCHLNYDHPRKMKERRHKPGQMSLLEGDKA